MPGPFRNNIGGTTAGAAGTGAFTPNAAAPGCLAWSTVNTGWMGLVRYEDGSAWGLQYSYWDGTTLSRSSNQDVASSTGSPLSLTSAAIAYMAVDAASSEGNLIESAWRGHVPIISTATLSAIGLPAATITGTAAAAAFGNTALIDEQPAIQLTSLATANAQLGISNTAACTGVCQYNSRGRGWEFMSRFAISGLPATPRCFVGMTSTSFIANTGNPSALVAHYAVLGKDSTDTNLQFLTNSGVGTGTKIDTGIALAALGVYQVNLWQEGQAFGMRLFRLDTGAIYYLGLNASGDLPGNGQALMPQAILGLSAASTAMVCKHGGFMVRSGA